MSFEFVVKYFWETSKTSSAFGTVATGQRKMARPFAKFRDPRHNTPLSPARRRGLLLGSTGRHRISPALFAKDPPRRVEFADPRSRRFRRPETGRRMVRVTARQRECVCVYVCVREKGMERKLPQCLFLGERENPLPIVVVRLWGG